ncbi:MAG: hypothetical protein Q9214_004226, partial [Letrouitia sp. 1 TL-2023]
HPLVLLSAPVRFDILPCSVPNMRLGKRSDLSLKEAKAFRHTTKSPLQPDRQSQSRSRRSMSARSSCIANIDVTTIVGTAYGAFGSEGSKVISAMALINSITSYGSGVGQSVHSERLELKGIVPDSSTVRTEMARRENASDLQ